MRTLIYFCIIFTFAFSSNVLNASDINGLRLAQIDADDESFDPFADYSEFENTGEEEADINFFLNGRMFNFGFLIGYRDWTGEVAKLSEPSYNLGFFLTFYFSLSFAFELDVQHGNNKVEFVDVDNNNEILPGSISATYYNFNIKYYLYLQNVTRGLAAFNPYILLGYAYSSRTITLTGTGSNFVKDTGTGFTGGLGFEIPVFDNSAYLGLQAKYYFLNFDLEAAPNDGSPRFDGDTYVGSLVIGINF